MSVTATSGLAVFLTTVRNMLSRSSTFQALVGAASAAEALPFIYPEYVPQEGDSGKINIPSAVVAIGDGFEFTRIGEGASHLMWPNYQAWVAILTPQAAPQTEPTAMWDNWITKANAWGGVLTDLAEMCGDGSGDTVAADSIGIDVAPGQTPPELLHKTQRPFDRFSFAIVSEQLG